jgi:hypothetical protein
MNIEPFYTPRQLYNLSWHIRISAGDKDSPFPYMSVSFFGGLSPSTWVERPPLLD